jgi:cold shock protein
MAVERGCTLERKEGPTMAQGTIIRLTERGFGFIDYGAEKDMYFHSTALEDVTFDELHKGDRVGFDIEANPEGRGDRAAHVRRVDALPRSRYEG